MATHDEPDVPRTPDSPEGEPYDPTKNDEGSVPEASGSERRDDNTPTGDGADTPQHVRRPPDPAEGAP